MYIMYCVQGMTHTLTFLFKLTNQRGGAPSQSSIFTHDVSALYCVGIRFSHGPEDIYDRPPSTALVEYVTIAALEIAWLSLLKQPGEHACVTVNFKQQ